MELKYQTSASGWGVQGFFEGQRLVFSATRQTSPTFKKKWLRFLPLFKNSDKGPSEQSFEVSEPVLAPRLAWPQAASSPYVANKKNTIITSLDVYRLFSKDAKRAWAGAAALAKKQKMEIGVEDIFLALLKEQAVKKFLRRLNANTCAAETLLKNYLKMTPSADPVSAKKIPFEAFALSVQLHAQEVDSLMLLGALIKTTPKNNILQAIFTNIGLTKEKLEIFSVWSLGLNYSFPQNSKPAQILYCFNQAKNLEEHFGYFFEFSAIEAAVKVSSIQTFKDMGHLKALEYLVKAGLVAKEKRSKVINNDLVAQAIF